MSDNTVPAAGVPVGVKLGVILASMALPLVGIIAGLTYLRSDDPEKRKVGKPWLFIAVGLFLAYGIILFALYLRPKLACPPSC